VEFYSRNRLLSDGTKAPAVPQWLLLVLLIAVIAFLIFALSTPAWVFAFFLELWRR
jgi:hypothetical protein